MKIGIDYTVGVYQGSGIGRYARGLVHGLAALDRANDYTLLWASANGPEGRELPRLDALDGFPRNFHTHKLPLNNRWMTALWQRARLPLPVERFTGPLDLFHAPDFVLPPVRRARRLVTVHDLTFLVVPQYAHPRLRAYLQEAVPRNVRAADHIFADSAATSADLQRLLDVPAEKISVVYVGADPQFRPFTAEERATSRPALTAAGVPEGSYLLSVGTIEPRKNHVGLLEACARLRRRGLPHRLVIAGKRGWLDEPVFAAVERLGLGASVTFLDFFPDALLPALYNHADLLLLPSFYEGFGIPLLEALACGTPAIAGDRPSLPEIAGGAAVLVDPDDVAALADASWDLLHDAPRRADLRARGLDRARAFTWRESATRVLARYHAIG